jgi:hypothetical protein
MAADPFSGDVIKLEGGANRWRRRVGNYRIFFAVDTVVAVSTRITCGYADHRTGGLRAVGEADEDVGAA